MKSKLVYFGICLSAGLIMAGGLAPKTFGNPDKAKPSGAGACFDRLKKLTGDWTQKDESSGKEVVALRYRLTSGGSTLEETEFPGSDHEMVTMYNLDNDSLVLTHYCHLGNQPHMKATAESTPSKIVFECTGVGNSKSHTDTHMHALTLTIKDSDHLTAEWTLSQDGKPGHVAKFDVQRKAKN